MSDCARFESLMEGLLAGEYEEGADGSFPKWAAAARREILAHVEACDACGQVYGLHEWLAREAPGLEEPEPSELASVRSRVLARIREETPAAATPAGGVSWWRPRVALLGAAASLLIVAGALLGRVVLPRAGSALEAGGGFEDLPYAFTNVSVEPAGAGLMSLSFDVTRRVRMQRRHDDPLVREALVQSLRGPAPLGDRLRALSLAGDLMNAAVREALIDAMRHDENVAVRLRALETLGRQPADPGIQQAMLAVLAEEESVQMRLLAIDYLGAARVAPDRILTAIEESPPAGTEALLVRAGERLGL